MTARDVRNRIVEGLYQYMQIPINLADQISPESELPYIVYSVTTPYIRSATLGHFGCRRNDKGDIIEIRSEQAGMTLSFTVCSQNRTDAAGNRIWGEDEAMDLAEKAQGWFLHAGRHVLSPDVVVDSVENVASRSVLMVDEEANRFGFDVLVKYIREDMKDTGKIETAVSKGKEY